MTTIEQLRRETWAGLCQRPVTVMKLQVWAATELAGEAGDLHPASPWTSLAIENARGAAEACQAGHEDAVAEFSRRAGWAALAASYEPDDGTCACRAWLELTRMSRERVHRLVEAFATVPPSLEWERAPEVCIGSITKLRKRDAHSTSRTPEDDHERRRQAIAMMTEEVDRLTGEAGSLCVSGQAGEAILVRIADVGVKAATLGLKVSDQTGLHLRMPGTIGWAPQVGPAACVMLTTPWEGGKDPAHPVALTAAQAAAMVKAASGCNIVCWLWRAEIEVLCSVATRATALSVGDAALYWGLAEGDRDGREGHRRRLVGAAGEILRTLWAGEAAAEAAALAAGLDEGDRNMAFLDIDWFARPTTGKALIEAVDMLNGMAEG